MLVVDGGGSLRRALVGGKIAASAAGTGGPASWSTAACATCRAGRRRRHPRARAGADADRAAQRGAARCRDPHPWRMDSAGGVAGRRCRRVVARSRSPSTGRERGERQARTTSSRRSRPPLSIATFAASRTLGLAWYATERPAAAIIGRSLAPSPTAIACAARCRARRRSRAASCASRRRRRCRPRAGRPCVRSARRRDLEHVAAREVDAQPVAHAVGEEGEAARHEQRLQPGRLAGARPAARRPGLNRSRSS